MVVVAAVAVGGGDSFGADGAEGVVVVDGHGGIIGDGWKIVVVVAGSCCCCLCWYIWVLWNCGDHCTSFQNLVYYFLFG